MVSNTAEQIADYAGIGRMRAVPAVAAWGDDQTQEFYTARADRPLLFKGIATETAELDWQDVATALKDTPVPVRTVVWFGNTAIDMTGTIRFAEFDDHVGELRHAYLAELYLFRGFTDLLPQVTKHVPRCLMEDYLALLPPSWRYLSATSRTNIYYGADQSRTLFHVDSMCTVTWNMCLNGTKRWLLFDARPGTVGQRVLEQIGRTFVDRTRAETLLREHPELEMLTVDVEAGDILYVPWTWAHQVQNIGTAFAVARYYVGPQNVKPFLDSCHEQLGTLGATALRQLLGSAGRRAWLQRPVVKRLCGHRVATVVARSVLPRGAAVGRTHHWFS